MAIEKTNLTAKELEILTLDAEDKQRLMEIECHMRAHKGFNFHSPNRFATTTQDPMKEYEVAEEIHKNVTEKMEKIFPKRTFLEKVNLLVYKLLPWVYK